MSTHPYRGLPGERFWSSGVASVAGVDLDPVPGMPFTVSPRDAVAAAGSCFAQHIARFLRDSGYNFIQAEPPLAADEPVFSARFGNIYTVRQLRQLVQEAYGLHRPRVGPWQRPDGRFIDALRPQLFPGGFASAQDVGAARHDHLLAIRRVLQECQVFVFTLGLTEAWLSPDGTVLPVPPGVLGIDPPEGAPRFHNLTGEEMRRDMDAFLADLASVNPAARVILTVSPVPLVATYEARHVLVSNTYSKAALRVLAEETARGHPMVAYFPSYEIITAPQTGAGYFEPDLRSVTGEGVAHVMRLFARHVMTAAATDTFTAPPRPPSSTPTDKARARDEAIQAVLCDEELLDSGEGA